jgi:hypothetical protein
MTDEADDEGEDFDLDFSPESYPDTLQCPDGTVHFGIDAQTFLLHWVGKIGQEVTGAAVVFGEGCGLLILHPETGELLTPAEIAKRSRNGSIRSLN